MRYLSGGRFALADFTLPMKLALSFFVLFVLLGLTSSVALYHQQFAFEAERAADYYRGDRGEGGEGGFMVEKSYRQLLETAHFHLFIMPVVYLALLHLYFLTPRPTAEQAAVTVVTFTGLLLEVLAPWLIRFAGAGWAHLFWVSGPAITLGTLWASGVCLWELWAGTPTPSRAPTSD